MGGQEICAVPPFLKILKANEAMNLNILKLPTYEKNTRRFFN